VLSHEQWFAARKAFLAKEREFTRLRDELNEQRRNLPWEAVDERYVFEGPDGKQTLQELFDGRSQLVIYHFMFDPNWEAGCPHCSFWAHNFNPVIVHLNQRDVTMIAVSRAPYGKLAASEKRMGWSFRWVSCFIRTRRAASFTRISTHARGIDILNTAYNYLGLTPKSRDEGGRGQFWVRRHDQYAR
jgi:predicted dithiol-disulfide oxidoreductase (DUF899 family)